MRYKLFGNSGLRVSELCMGALTFGQEAGFGVDKGESRKLFDVYADAGGNFIDTANMYNQGTSETYLGEFLGGQRDHFVVATKWSLAMRKGDPNSGGNQRKSLVQALESSLKRMHTDYVDLYWLHQWDYTTPVEEVMRALDDLVRAGKVLYVGISDAPAWVVAQANTLAGLRGWTPFTGIQIEYSLIERTPEREILPMAKAFGLAVALWGVVGQSVLTGKYHRANDPSNPRDSRRAAIIQRRLTEKNLDIARLVEQVAGEKGCTASQVAINWVRQRDPMMVPIIGARTLEQLHGNLACLDCPLSAEEMGRLDAASAIELGFPHDFLLQPRILEQRFGGTQELIDNHHRLHHLRHG